MPISIPKKQIIYNTKTYQKDNAVALTDDPKIYLSRYLNTLLRQLVSRKDSYSNTVIGVQPFFVDLVNNSIFRVVISPGCMIIDSTLISISDPVFLDIDLTTYENYDEVVVVAAYKYLINNNKASFQLMLRNSKTGEVDSNSGLLIDKLMTPLILCRYRLKRDSNNKIIEIYHPYGRFINQFYSEFLLAISQLAKPINNIIFERLIPEPGLYKPFLIRDFTLSITVPLFLNHLYEDGTVLADSINKLYTTKMYRRYPIDSITNFYFSKIDRNIRFKTELFDA